MKKPNRLLWKYIYKTHRYIGLISAIVLLMLSVTGIILNHTDTFQLDSRFVHNQRLLDWYGISRPQASHTFKSTTHYASQFEQQLYLNKHLLLKTDDVLQGIIETPEFIAIALKNSLLLLSLNGELIEKIEKNNLNKIGRNANEHIFIQQAGNILTSTDGLLSWQSHPLENSIQWSQKIALPNSIATAIQHNAQQKTLPFERVFLDLHSGRFFGKIGVLIVDLCGIFLILLVLSGSSIWIRHAFFRHRKK